MLIAEAYALDFKLLGGSSLSSYAIYPNTYYWGWDYSRFKSSYKPGFLFGLGVEWPVSKNFAMEIDVLYFRKGSEIKASLYDGSSWKRTYVLNAVSLPVLAKVRLLPNSSPYLLHGGELFYVLSHKYKYASVAEFLFPSDDQD
ncbi:MAG: outer membrane beta-barrel protein, partial [Acidobacteriota bacterium]